MKTLHDSKQSRGSKQGGGRAGGSQSLCRISHSHKAAAIAKSPGFLSAYAAQNKQHAITKNTMKPSGQLVSPLGCDPVAGTDEWK